MCRNRMCNNFIVEGSYKKDPLINPSVTANASHVRHNDFQRPNRIFTSQIFDDLKLLPLPVTNSFCEPLPFTRYPFFSRATSASSFAIRSCNWPISSNVLLVCSAAYRLPHRSRCDARPASPCSPYSFIQRSNILKSMFFCELRLRNMRILKLWYICQLFRLCKFTVRLSFRCAHDLNSFPASYYTKK